MDSNLKTVVFAAVALVSVGIALVVRSQTSDPVVADSVEVGGYFYPNPEDETEPAFADPTIAKGLELATFDDETAELETFEIAFRDGVWRLVNFNGYPADAETRLARTLTSVSYVRKEGLQTRRPTDHGELGVLDPLDESTHGEQGHGERITITDVDGEELVDLIVGKSVPDSDTQNLHYVRRADEDEVYRAIVDLDVSTRFRDWINDDLLALDPSNDIADITVAKLSEPDPDETPEEKKARDEKERERRERMKKSEIIALTIRPPVTRGDRIVEEELELARGDGGRDDWSLAGIDEATEELDGDPVRAIVNTLDSLKIVGVRRKPDGLNADLTVSVPSNPLLQRAFIDTIRNDLVQRGFMIVQNADEQLGFASSNGGLVAAADNGVVYNMHFGREFTGSERQLQIGETAEGDDDDERSGRYLVVHVTFDEDRVAGKPKKPVEPTKPPELDAPADPQPKEPNKEDTPKDDAEQGNEAAGDDESKDDDAADTDDAANDDVAAGDATDDGTSTDATDDGGDAPKDGDEPADDPKPTREELQADYDLVMAEYRRDLVDYEKALEKWQARRDYGEERSKVLNERFGDWYYVISASDFEEFSLTRTDLVKAKEPPAEPEGMNDPAGPTPGPPGTPPENSTPPGETTPPADDPQPEEPKPADPKPGETPADDSPADDSPEPTGNPGADPGE